MRIGWLIPTVGAFGAVREMVEVSNVWVRRGHAVTLYHPSGGPCVWLPSQAKTATIEELARADLDVLIGIVDWQPDLYSALLKARAAVKAICLMGFSPSEEMAAALRGEQAADNRAWRMMRDAIQRGLLMLADSSWQAEWAQTQVGIEVGPSFGGINLQQFQPPLRKPERKVKRIIASGDPRPRKDSGTVEAAVTLLQRELPSLEFDTYWGKRFTQRKLVEFLQSGDVFLDGHLRAGWCNPVIEAMACGCPPVCTDIGAVRDFATHEQTALVVPPGDAEAMAAEAKRLLTDDDLHRRLRDCGLARVRQFDYELVAPELARWLAAKVQEAAYA